MRILVILGVLGCLYAFQNCTQAYVLEVSDGSAARERMVTVNGGATFTSNGDITLDLNYPGATEYYLTKDPTCLTGGEWKPMAASIQVHIDGPDAYYVFYVRFKTSAGFLTTCYSGGVTLDTEPALILVTHLPGEFSRESSYVFRYEVVDQTSGVSKVECRLDGSDFQDCTGGSFAVSGLIDGDHVAEFKAHDRAGLQSEVRTYSWKVDSVAPVLQLNNSLPATTSNTFATFEFSAQDANGIEVYNCKLDTGEWAACVSPHTISALTVGGHQMQVMAVDPAGNQSQILSYSWSIQ